MPAAARALDGDAMPGRVPPYVRLAMRDVQRELERSKAAGETQRTGLLKGGWVPEEAAEFALPTKTRSQRLRLGLRGQMRDPVCGEPHMRQTADGVRFEREPPAAGVEPWAVHSSPARARSALRAPAATRQAATASRMLSRPIALLGSDGPFDPTASGYSSVTGPKKRARRCCAECRWPQSGLGHELDGGRRVGGKRGHASMAGRRTMAWGPCQVVFSDWNPDMPSAKRAKALRTRAARESSQALL